MVYSLLYSTTDFHNMLYSRLYTMVYSTPLARLNKLLYSMVYSIPAI